MIHVSCKTISSLLSHLPLSCRVDREKEEEEKKEREEEEEKEWEKGEEKAREEGEDEPATYPE